MRSILTDAQAAVLADERRVLGDLRVALASFGAAPDAQATLERSIAQLDELFLLVVAGEFNAGKSAVINALVGTRALAEGVTPTTSEITRLAYGDDGAAAAVTRGGIHTITVPVEILRHLHIVDTPGTNAVIREHEALTTEFVPQSDLVLFVTSADRPFTETERAFLERIRDWGKKVVVAINKVDILEKEEDVREVAAFVSEHGTRLLGVTPAVFPISARAALRAKQGDPSAWAASRFEALERHIHDTLDDAGRVRLKLMNPLGVGGHLIDRYAAASRERLDLLKDDFALLDDVERQLQVHEADTTAGFDLRMTEIDSVLLQMERRGHDFFDETLRIGRMFDLLNRARMQQAFEQEVVADAPAQIERKVNDLVDWMVETDFRQWQAITRHLSDRRREYKDRIVGDADGAGFHLDRRRLLESIGGAAQRVVESYDKAQESRMLADGARNAVAAAAATGAGALGLGTLVTVAASTAAADVTGIVMATAIAGIGFFIIPARRRKAKDEMRTKISAVRSRLSESIRERFSGEIRASGERIRESIAPYSRFIRAEHQKLEETAAQLQRLRASIDGLKVRIAAV